MLSALFIYSFIHEGTNLCVPCRCCCRGGKWRHQLSFYFVLFFFYCDSVIKLDCVRVIVSQEDRDRCVSYGQRKACSAFCLPPLTDWLNVALASSLSNPENKNWKSPQSPEARGFPQPTITNLIYCLVLWQRGRNRRSGVIWKKWGSGGRWWR